MYMLFQHLLFISLNRYYTKVHIQYQEYIIISIILRKYHHFLMYLAFKKLMSRYSGTLCLKIHLFKITKCLALYICSYITCISNNFLNTWCARILKVKPKISFTLWSFDRPINITETIIQIYRLYFAQD